jgi:polysaccharide export outer membrane protein
MRLNAMKLKKYRFIFLLPILASTLLLNGCASGMHMNMHRLTPAVNKHNQIVAQKIQLINAAFVQQEQIKKQKALQLAKQNYHPPRGFSAGSQGYHYTVQPQDLLQIIVWNEEGNSGAGMGGGAGMDSLSGAINTSRPSKLGHRNQFVVNSQGDIFYPYIGSIHVQGKTVGEVRRLMSKKMSHFFPNPQITVNVDQFNSQRIAVTGAVLKPSMIPITNVPLNVLTAVTQAGGPIQCGAVTSLTTAQTLCADLHDVQIRRNKKTEYVDLNKLTAVNGSSNNWILKNGDIVFVPNNNASRIFVLGAVNSPNPYNMIDGKMSLREALGDARGMATGSNPAFTYVIRDFHQNPKIYLLNISSPDALNLAGEFYLKPGDVVFVSTSLVHNFNELLTDVTPALLTAVSVQALSR